MELILDNIFSDIFINSLFQRLSIEDVWTLPLFEEDRRRMTRVNPVDLEFFIPPS